MAKTYSQIVLDKNMLILTKMLIREHIVTLSRLTIKPSQKDVLTCLNTHSHTHMAHSFTYASTFASSYYLRQICLHGNWLIATNPIHIPMNMLKFLKKIVPNGVKQARKVLLKGMHLRIYIQ